MRLPPSRAAGTYSVALVCLGNICRSPMAHVVLEERLAEAGLGAPDGPVTVTSSGTGGWHVGETMDERAAATLTAAGYDATRHCAQQYDAAAPADLVLAMDGSNRSAVRAIAPEPDRVVLFRALDPDLPPDEPDGADVPDPYYGGAEGFADVLSMVERTAAALVERLAEQEPWREHPR